jgi:hypothetical protein
MAATRRTKEEKPVLAICYDFDKTLSPDDMQAQGYIQAVYDGDVPSFRKESNKMAEKTRWTVILHICIRWLQSLMGVLFLQNAA